MLLHLWLLLHISVVIPLFASPQSVKLAMVRMSAARVLRAPPAPAEGMPAEVQSHRCLPVVQAGMTHLQRKVGLPLLPPLFLLFWKQAICCESSAELMPSGQKLWKQHADGAPQVQQQPGWCLQLRVDMAGQAARKAHGTARYEEGKDQYRGGKGAGTPSRIKGCCHKSLSVMQWDHLSICGRFP